MSDNLPNTAVEHLICSINDIVDYIPVENWEAIRKAVFTAKKIEKAQIENAALWGYVKGRYFEGKDIIADVQNYYQQMINN